MRDGKSPSACATLLLDPERAGVCKPATFCQHRRQRVGKRVKLRGELQDGLPCGERLCLVLQPLVKFRLAQPCHEIAAIGIDCCVERRHFARIIAHRALGGGKIAP